MSSAFSGLRDMMNSSNFKVALDNSKSDFENAKNLVREQLKSISKPVAVVDKNGVDLDVLSKGGVTKFKRWDVYVHTNNDCGLPMGKWHFRDALGNRVFIKTLKREIAQEFVDLYYGKGRYQVSASAVG